MFYCRIRFIIINYYLQREIKPYTSYTTSQEILTEIELIQELKLGKELAFNQLVHLHKNLVFNTALGIVQQTQEAEDVSQEVFIQVYKSIADFKSESKLSTWLYKITVSKSLDVVRKKKAKKRLGNILSVLGIVENEKNKHAATFYHPGIAAEQKEQASILFKAIDKLPAQQKAVFILLKTENLSYADVATIMNTTVKALEGLMHRAKENLRKELTTYYKTL